MDTPPAKATVTKENIVDCLLLYRREFESLGVKKLGLFGSYVENKHCPNGDVDVLVEFDPEAKTFDNFIRLSLLLDEILLCQVELVTAKSLSPHIAPRILPKVEYVISD
ncbi:MAG: nucleotidyltransferase [Leptolyngbyaceae cyanobacterium SM1_1_3]|nr:nucleotidyltransferase [Leptolyngbyaceae cyanobacterium SM1_1_3]NJN02489.1 nucleotidyltransferase [Leptolyngbyaceae cyanobacterium RM1_1_2]NJO11651.1 nucleotidyltransferase [Leptolyngbyaceae cyanobacterium SL_1_1]